MTRTGYVWQLWYRTDVEAGAEELGLYTSLAKAQGEALDHARGAGVDALAWAEIAPASAAWRACCTFAWGEDLVRGTYTAQRRLVR